MERQLLESCRFSFWCVIMGNLASLLWFHRKQAVLRQKQCKSNAETKLVLSMLRRSLRSLRSSNFSTLLRSRSQRLASYPFWHPTGGDFGNLSVIWVESHLKIRSLGFPKAKKNPGTGFKISASFRMIRSKRPLLDLGSQSFQYRPETGERLVDHLLVFECHFPVFHA